MPPKKTSKGGAKKDSAGDKDKEMLRLAQSEVANLQQHIEIQKHDVVHARRMEQFWRQVCCRWHFGHLSGAFDSLAAVLTSALTAWTT